MNKTKIASYFLYAVGEIFLVVIGILIAVNINNWNQNQKDIVAEKLLLQEVLSALEADSLSMQKTLSLTQRTYEVHRKLFEISQGNSKVKEVKDIYLIRRSLPYNTVTNRNYPNLAADVLDDSLKLLIQNYYQGLGSWDFIINNYNEFIEDEMRSILRDQELMNYGFFYGEKRDITLDENINHMIDQEKLLAKLGEPIIQQLLNEATVKALSFTPFWDNLNIIQKQLQAKIREVLDQE